MGTVSFTYPEPSCRPAPGPAGRATPQHSALTSAGHYSTPSPPPNPPRPAASSEDLPSPPLPAGRQPLSRPRKDRRRNGSPTRRVRLNSNRAAARPPLSSLRPGGGQGGRRGGEDAQRARRAGLRDCRFPSSSAVQKGFLFPLSNLHFSPYERISIQTPSSLSSRS